MCGITDNGMDLLMKAIREKYTEMNQLNVVGTILDGLVRDR